MRESLKFGYNGGLPPDVRTAWGCRAIVQYDAHALFSLDIPPDRQSGFGHDDSLLGYIRDHDGDEWINKATQMFATGELTVTSSDEVTLFEDKRAVIKASPQRSCGYLYVCAFYKPTDPMDPEEVRRKIAALFGEVQKPNDQCPVDYTDPRIQWLADITAGDLLRAHNEGDSSVDVELLFAIGDEEGWS